MQHELQAYAVKDIKSQLFALPHFVATNGVAIRSFATACEDKSTNLNLYPSDYTLYHIGSYNAETGVLTKANPASIATAAEFIKPPVYVTPDVQKPKNLI